MMEMLVYMKWGMMDCYYNPCEKMLLDVARYYPLFKPARFSVNMQDKYKWYVYN